MSSPDPAVEAVMRVLDRWYEVNGPDWASLPGAHMDHLAREVVAALDPVMRKAKAEAHDEGHITACPVKGCEGLGRNPYRIEAAVSDRHDPTWFHAGRYGRWCQCTCGWKSPHGTPIVAQLAFGTHLLDVRDA